MKNNKGQTLVLFILILPIILIILAIVINYGILSNEKLKIENNLKQAIEYGLNLKLNNIVIEDNVLTNENIKEKIQYLLEQNIKYDSLDIVVNNNSISINVTKSNNQLLNVFYNQNSKFEISYYGTLNNQEIMIERR